ncbi:MAG: Aldo/keto reductase, SCO1670 family, partial [uncultured Corynebacteriales bacterium]
GAAPGRQQRPGRVQARPRHGHLGPRHRPGRRRGATGHLPGGRRHPAGRLPLVRLRADRAADRPAAVRRGAAGRAGAGREVRRADRPRRGRPRAVPRRPAHRAGQLDDAARGGLGRPVAGARLGLPGPDGGGPLRRRHRRDQRPGPVRRAVEPARLAHRRGRGLAAGLARPGRAGRDPGGVLAAGARGRARGAAGLRVGRDGGAGVLAAGPGGADRQVPARGAVGLPGRLPAPARLRRPPPHRRRGPDRRGGGHRRRGPRHLAAGGLAGLGPGPAGGQRVDPGRPYGRAAVGVAGRRRHRAAGGDPRRPGRRLGSPGRVPGAVL